MKYAIVNEDGIVENLIEADAGYASVNNLIFAEEQYVGVGFTYSEEDGFRPPKPYPSWTWEYCESCGGVYRWKAPVEFPEDGARGPLEEGILYSWDEDSLSWVAPE